MHLQRLLILAERFPPDIGGVARSASRIARSVCALGIDVHVAAWSRQLPAGAVETVQTPEGITLHRIGLFGSWDLSFQHSLTVLEWLHAQHPYGAVWGHYLYPAGFMAVLSGELAGIPSIVSARGNDIDRLIFPPGDFARLMWSLERAHTVTAVSGDLARKISVLLGRETEVDVLPNVVDNELFTPGAASAELRQRVGILEGELVLGFSGELRYKKGIDFILQALLEVRRDKPACLLVIGEVRGEDEVRLMNFATEHPEDASRVVVTGALTDPGNVRDHLRLCDLYLQPSVWEGAPNALLEAMACGLPVIVSDAGGIPEVVQHGVSGWVIPRVLLHQLGTAISEVMALPQEERARVGAQGRRRVAEQFHPGVEADALLALFARLSTPRPS